MTRPDFAFGPADGTPHQVAIELERRMEAYAGEAKREADVAARALTFFRAWLQCGRFKVIYIRPVDVRSCRSLSSYLNRDASKPDAWTEDVRPHRTGEYGRDMLNAIADCYNYAERSTR